MALGNKAIKTAMILAAGFGKRLRPITESVPKALVPVDNRKMLDIIIAQIRGLGIDKIIINTHYLAEQIADHIKKYKDFEIIISYEKEILGTGGGILNAMEKISQETYLVVNCDCLLLSDNGINPLLQLSQVWNPDKMDFLLLSHPLEKAPFHKKSGDYNLDKSGKIVKGMGKQHYIWSGAYIVKPEFFEGYQIQHFPITDITFSESKKDRCYGVINKGDWVDIGSLEALEYANNLMMKR